MAVLAGVCMSVTDDVGVGVGDGQMAVHPLQVLDILVVESRLTSPHVDLGGFTHVTEINLLDVATHVLDVVDEVADQSV